MASNVALDAGISALTEFERLERAVRLLLQATESWQRRARQAEARASELQEALEGVRAGTLDPLELKQRAATLDAENQALRERVQAADLLVQRIQARLQFMEEER